MAFGLLVNFQQKGVKSETKDILGEVSKTHHAIQYVSHAFDL